VVTPIRKPVNDPGPTATAIPDGVPPAPRTSASRLRIAGASVAAERRSGSSASWIGAPVVEVQAIEPQRPLVSIASNPREVA